MAVRSQELRSNNARTHAARTRPMSVTPTVSFNTLAYATVILLALLAIYAVMGNVVSWAQGKADDLRYGTPRTFHMDAVVGHNDGAGTPTHLIAMNLNRQVIVLELPGGDAAQIRTLTGPYLFGANEDKTPVLMRLEDLNRDGSNDLIVTIKNEEIVYLNRDGEFKLMSPEERAQIAPSP